MEHEVNVLTEKQRERVNVSAYAAVFTIIVVIGTWIWWGSGKFATIDADNKAVTETLTRIEANQTAGQLRADVRQAAADQRINDAESEADARFRPLEAQSAATAATLQAINNNLLSLGADLRDLRRDLQDEPAREKP